MEMSNLKGGCRPTTSVLLCMAVNAPGDLDNTGGYKNGRYKRSVIF